jgi:hypothetical protein
MSLSMIGFRRLTTSSCQARAIAVLSTCVVAGQAPGGAGWLALPPTHEAQSVVHMSTIEKQRMLDYCWSGDAFWSPGLSISAPIFLDTLGALPV